MEPRGGLHRTEQLIPDSRDRANHAGHHHWSQRTEITPVNRGIPALLNTLVVLSDRRSAQCSILPPTPAPSPHIHHKHGHFRFRISHYQTGEDVRDRRPRLGGRLSQCKSTVHGHAGRLCPDADGATSRSKAGTGWWTARFRHRWPGGKNTAPREPAGGSMC
jgi:hypothetical protein